MNLYVDVATAQPLDHLHLAVVHDHTVVDVELVHVMHAARRRGVESFMEEQQPPGGTKRFGALPKVGCKDSNAQAAWNDRSAQIVTVFGELVATWSGLRTTPSLLWVSAPSPRAVTSTPGGDSGPSPRTATLLPFSATYERSIGRVRARLADRAVTEESSREPERYRRTARWRTRAAASRTTCCRFRTSRSPRPGADSARMPHWLQALRSGRI
jgi:hypothetical protein